MNNQVKLLFTAIFVMTTAAAAMAKDMAMQQAPMSEEQKAMMVRMQEYSTPNANHEVLKALVGNWKTHGKFWMSPDQPPQENDGTAEAKMIMDGRFVEQNYSGSMMGQPFSGRALWGYDNIKKHYTGLWFDNMATGIMVSSATYDPSEKTLTEEGSMSCPMTNETDRWYKAVTTFVDTDHYTYESFMKDPVSGKVYTVMTISYTRAQ